MLPFIEIKPTEIRLQSGQLVLKKAQYQQHLTAAELIAAAQAEAREIVLAAQAIFDQQKALGWQAGIEEARIQQATLIQKTYHQCYQYYRQVELQLAQVVLQAVRKILHDYDDVALTCCIVRQAFALVNHQKQVIFHVHPDQVARVREQIAQILKAHPEKDYIEVIPDTHLAQGGCIIETEMGIVDASVEGQLAALANALKPDNLASAV